MEGIDIALLEFDRNNPLYFFMMNADQEIYMRYGGRDSESASTYLNIRSLELALQQGLDLHESQSDRPKFEKPEPLFPRDIPLLVERTIKRNACVECHLIGDFQNQHKELDGTLDRLVDLYQSPDIKTLGIHLNVPKGLEVADAKVAAADAGMESGDLITHLAGHPVLTFGDLQYQLNKIDRKATQLELTVSREDQSRNLTLDLPPRWWLTDLEYRHWTVEPELFFKSSPLTNERRQELGLDPDGLASEVTEVDFFEEFSEPAIEEGDVLFAVGGVTKDPIANSVDLYIRLNVKSGDSIQIEVLRDGKKFQSTVKTRRRSFRK